ncbi:MAG TPA: CorA family divalent cation transporter [Nitrospirales bacterium]|nr:hypothetical protein [Nitrospiraceae bacterium]HNP30331.1 CorA family divalent cation transporter [Nitrospirales bacterium]
MLLSWMLLAEETRPRITLFDDSLLLILRGVNFNPGAGPDDMVSIRLYIDAYPIVSVRHRPHMTIKDIHSSSAIHNGPISSGDFLAVLTDRLMERTAPVIGRLDEEIGDIEDQMIEQASRQLRSQLGILRRQAISLPRYIAPNGKSSLNSSWLKSRG